MGHYILNPANWIMGVLDNVILSVMRQRRLRADEEVEAVVDPLDCYQGVLDRLVREQEVAEQMAEIMGWRMRRASTSGRSVF